MKYALILAAAIALTGCYEEDDKVNGLRDITKGYTREVCYDGVKYILYDKGITAKINETSRRPEGCSE